jgi:hypothetical protein
MLFIPTYGQKAFFEDFEKINQLLREVNQLQGRFKPKLGI